MWKPYTLHAEYKAALSHFALIGTHSANFYDFLTDYMTFTI